ncbi:hypothetical protein [Prevotella dentasini]|uniref:hypothetical protein n=1 Tax=Prevotella dentasini TaxID=589537 RepID=UPI000468097C|nr:hypothetical protein [Prevotella dentasini]
MRKRILILKACGGSDEPHECNGICEQAQLYGIESVCKYVKNNEDLEDLLYSHGLFDYIYLSAHGNSEGFSSEDEKVNMSWQKLAMLLCKSKCMNEDSILMLSCCRGGLMEVAYDIFLTCQQICYVLGPRQSLTSADMHICFGIFLYNMEIRSADPVVACEKIKLATDQHFSCYDRQEESISLSNYREMHYGYE